MKDKKEIINVDSEILAEHRVGFDKEYGFSDFFRVLKARWYWIVFLAFGALVYNVWGVRALEDKYTATAVIMPLEDRPSRLLDPELENSDIIQKIMMSDVSGRLDSRKSIRIHNVLNTANFSARIVEKYDMLPELFPELWDVRTGSWIVNHGDNDGKTWFEKFLKEPAVLGSLKPDAIDGARVLQSSLLISKDTKKKTISISFTHSDPEYALMMVNRYVEEADLYFREDAIERYRANQVVLNKLEEIDVGQSVKVRLDMFIASQVELKAYAETAKNFMFEVIEPGHEPMLPSSNSKSSIIKANVAKVLFVSVLLFWVIDYIRYGIQCRKKL